MTDTLTPERIRAAYQIAVDVLVECKNTDGFWEGALSSSALSTATAVSALALAGVEGDARAIEEGVFWLARTQNEDGGWGDTTDSPSNLAATLLATAALNLAGSRIQSRKRESAKARKDPDRTCEDHTQSEPLGRAEAYIRSHAGGSIAHGIRHAYGADRTFAVPILVNCALAGMVSWDTVPPLPFELAAFPREWYKALRLHVVSYALPALIAIGLSIFHHSRRGNAFQRLVRRAVAKLVLAKLGRIQPEHGGFLDATPLTSFVAMSLTPVYGIRQPVVAGCLEFIRRSRRADGSWPIDSNLSVWTTTNAVGALACARGSRFDTRQTLDWIVARQHGAVHPYTGAAPGGWGWTHLSGGVPDADDTSGAVLACLSLGDPEAAPRGARWLRELQNSDGGWPTFCRGWGKLPFDKSSPDVTAHALRALAACGEPGSRRAIRRGFQYLANAQREDGAWTPLWFGNQFTADKSNPVIGTSLVLRAYEDSAKAAGSWCTISVGRAKPRWRLGRRRAGSVIDRGNGACGYCAAWPRSCCDGLAGRGSRRAGIPRAPHRRRLVDCARAGGPVFLEPVVFGKTLPDYMDRRSPRLGAPGTGCLAPIPFT